MLPAVSELMRVLKSDDTAGMVGGLLINADGSEQGGGRRAVPTPWRSFVRAFGLSHFANRWPKLFFDFYLHKQSLPAEPIEVEAISGACMLVKREAIEDVGPWMRDIFCIAKTWIGACVFARRIGRFYLYPVHGYRTFKAYAVATAPFLWNGTSTREWCVSMASF